MDIGDALGVLGLDPTASFEDIRGAYRDALMRHHPDRASTGDDDANAAERTEQIVTAFRLLRAETQDGRVPLATTSLLPALGSDSRPLVLVAQPGDLFQRLLAAIDSVAEISFVDRDSEILCAVITEQGTASQLSAEVDRSGPDAQILFTLESLTAGEPPDLADIVRRIDHHL